MKKFALNTMLTLLICAETTHSASSTASTAASANSSEHITDHEEREQPPKKQKVAIDRHRLKLSEKHVDAIKDVMYKVASAVDFYNHPELITDLKESLQQHWPSVLIEHHADLVQYAIVCRLEVTEEVLKLNPHINYQVSLSACGPIRPRGNCRGVAHLKMLLAHGAPTTDLTNTPLLVRLINNSTYYDYRTDADYEDILQAASWLLCNPTHPHNSINVNIPVPISLEDQPTQHSSQGDRAQPSRMTYLHLAGMHDNEHWFQFLLKHGANPCIKSSDDKSVDHWSGEKTKAILATALAYRAKAAEEFGLVLNGQAKELQQIVGDYVGPVLTINKPASTAVAAQSSQK